MVSNDKFELVFAQIIIQSDQWKFQNFSKIIGVDIVIRAVFTSKSTEDLKSKYKHRSDHYLGQTLNRLEAKKRNLCN